LFYTPSAPVTIGKYRPASHRGKDSEVNVLSDVDGVEAQRFGAETSVTLPFRSETAAFFSAAALLHRRGHSGNNAGESSIVP